MITLQTFLQKYTVTFIIPYHIVASLGLVVMVVRRVLSRGFLVGSPAHALRRSLFRHTLSERRGWFHAPRVRLLRES